MDLRTDNPTWLQRRLEELGWKSEHEPLSEGHVGQYQRFHGLKVDGIAGPVTERSLGELRFCGHPDVMKVQAATICRWDDRDLTWNAAKLPGLPLADVVDAYRQAWGYWADVCDVRPVYAANSKTVDVVMGAGHVDGPSGTLAWSELPCGPDKQLQQRYDTGEPWVIAENRHKIDLVRVAAHEIGHVIGIPHIGAGNLLAPTYSSSVRRPQSGDIAEARRRYGPAKAKPAPGPEPDPDPTDSPSDQFPVLAVEVNGRKYGTELKPL